MKTPVDGRGNLHRASGRASIHPWVYTRCIRASTSRFPPAPVMACRRPAPFSSWAGPRYGNFVKISHATAIPPTMATLSLRARQCAAARGCVRGQVFAYSGMSGMATGPHLHYEILVNSVQVNPLR